MKKAINLDGSIILLRRGNDVVVTDEKALLDELNEKYQEFQKESEKDAVTKEEYYCESDDFSDTLNGVLDYDAEEDKFSFQYDDNTTLRAYDHIKWVLKTKKEEENFANIMFFTLLALNACGVIGDTEFDTMYHEFCGVR